MAPITLKSQTTPLKKKTLKEKRKSSDFFFMYSSQASEKRKRKNHSISFELQLASLLSLPPLQQIAKQSLSVSAQQQLQQWLISFSIFSLLILDLPIFI
jgi:hypothetical protein